MDISALDDFTITLGGAGNLVLSFILALMMFAVALGLRKSHFAFFKTAPRHYIAGVLAQIIGLPLLTLIIIYALKPHPSLALGMILVACCPGGNVSNIMTLFGKGSTALSVSMTATSSLSAAILTPISILFWSSLYAPTQNLLTEINFDAISFLKQTLLILGLPILLGALTARFASPLAQRLQKPLSVISALCLILIIVAGIVKYWDLFLSFGAVLLPLVIVHNALAFALGYGTGIITRAPADIRRALTFEVGIQNSGLGLVILITQMSGLGGAAAITGAWGIWHIIGGGVMVWLFRRSEQRAGGKSKLA